MEPSDPYLELAKKHPSILMRSVWTGEPIEHIGCELAIGPGWFRIVDDLCTQIEQVLAGMSEEVRTGFYAQQVKEKFGGLRFYTTYGSDEIDELISEAEKKSFQTCEVCGEPGERRGEGWIQTLCEVHNAAD